MAETRPVLGLRIGTEISITRDTRSRRDLLKMADDPQYRAPLEIEDIMMQLEKQLGISPPLDHLAAVNRPSDTDLRWEQVYYPGALHAIYFAFDPTKSPNGNAPYHEAAAVIEASSSVSGLSVNTEGVITPRSLDITGFLRDTSGVQHISSLRYRLDDRQQLEQIAISLQPDYKIEKHWGHEPIPINKYSPKDEYFPELYPIIPQGMQEITRDTHFALAAFNRSFDDCNFGVTPRFEDIDLYERLVEQGSPGLRAFGSGVEKWVDSEQIVIFDWKLEYPNSVAKT